MSKLTQDQIDKLKILIQRYAKLDSEKEGIRILISETLGDYAEQIEEQFQDTIEEKMVTKDFQKGIILDEFPYFLEDHLNELQEERESNSNE